jgi:hypothetical protein
LVEESTSGGDFLAELARQAIAGAAVEDLGVLLERQQTDVWITDRTDERTEEREEMSVIMPIMNATQLPLFG